MSDDRDDGDGNTIDGIPIPPGLYASAVPGVALDKDGSVLSPKEVERRQEALADFYSALFLKKLHTIPPEQQAASQLNYRLFQQQMRATMVRHAGEQSTLRPQFTVKRRDPGGLYSAQAIEYVDAYIEAWTDHVYNGNRQRSPTKIATASRMGVGVSVDTLDRLLTSMGWDYPPPGALLDAHAERRLAQIGRRLARVEGLDEKRQIADFRAAFWDRHHSPAVAILEENREERPSS